MTLSLLVLLHGTDDPRMELIYFLASVLTVALPVGIFCYMGYRLFKTYLREKREATQNAPDAAPPRL